jgi:hypothetical protein
MNNDGDLRPIERRMLKLSKAGADDIEIAWRFRRTPKGVRQVMACSQLRRGITTQATPGGLRLAHRYIRNSPTSMSTVVYLFCGVATYLLIVRRTPGTSRT